MQNFRRLIRAACEKTRQENLTLPDEAQLALAGAMQTRLLKQLCTLLLEPGAPDGQRLKQARALCLQAQLFFREHGI